jgi:hypothetical protein
MALALPPNADGAALEPQPWDDGIASLARNHRRAQPNEVARMTSHLSLFGAGPTLLLSLSLLAACGGNIDVLGAGGQGAGAGTGAAGAGGTGSDGGSGGHGGSLPPSCAVDTPVSPPYSVTFRFFVVSGGSPVWLHQGCELELSVSSCADGFVSPLSMWAGCTVDCATAGNTCIACGACFEGGVEVDPSTPLELTWDANTYAFGTTAYGCQCSTATPAPAAHYRLSVPVYADEQATTQGSPLWTAELDFELPAPGGVVEVPLGGMI